MAKKPTPKSKRKAGKPRKEETAELWISQEVWDRYVKDLTKHERHVETRNLFAMVADQETVKGVKFCKIKIKKKGTTHSDDSDDDNGYEPKVCEEGE